MRHFACSWLAAATGVILLGGCGRAVSTNRPAEPRGDFRDVAAESGVRFRHDAGIEGRFLFVETTPAGCALLDYDRDGRVDLFFVQSGPTPGGANKPARPACALYRNLSVPGKLRFEDVTAAAGLDIDLGYAHGAAAADYDNDGFPDLYVTAYGGNHLLRNMQGARFADVTTAAGVGDMDRGSRWATSAAWADYNRDGLLDLYVCHYCRWDPNREMPCMNRIGERAYCTPTQYEPDSGRLYRNLGGGRFKDVSAESGIAKSGRGLGALWLDYDGDGMPDLYVANDLNPNSLFRNRGNGAFEERGLEAGVAYGADGQALSGMGIAAGDFDGDGREDLLVTNFSGQTVSLFRSSGRDQFVHSTREAGLTALTYAMLGWGTAFFDYDLDGDQDIVIGNGHVNPDVERSLVGVTYLQPKALFRNLGDGRFEDAAADRGGLSAPQSTRGLAIGDLDNDGRIDLIANNLGRAAEVFHHIGESKNAFLSLRLEGTRSNRDGIGARVRIVAGGRAQTATCRRSSSYLSSNDPRLSFGLGAAKNVDRIEIEWPSGARQVHASLADSPIPARAFLLAREGQPLRMDSTP